MATLNQNENPYVGPRTFRPQDRAKFFGRSREARDLTALIISNRLVLFYSSSGAGKSSLLNTMVRPMLFEAGFELLPTGRVSGYSGADVSAQNIFSYNLLLSLQESEEVVADFTGLTISQFLDNLIQSEDGVHRYDPAYVYPSDTVFKPRVLIIDQFEELITTNTALWPQRTGFFEQLAEAMRLDEQLWVVLTLREDFVARFDSFLHLLPNRLRHRYYMERLTRAAAMEAMQMPVAQIRPFTPDAIKLLANNLLRLQHTNAPEGEQLAEFIEPVQLQAVCYQMWEELRHHPRETIAVEDVARFADVDKALTKFYESTIEQTLAEVSVYEIELRDWFERELITEAGTRNMVYRGEEMTGNLPTKVADYVRQQFILGEIVRPGGTWYELVHDRFVPLIVAANSAWRQNNPLIRLAWEWDKAGRLVERLLSGQQLAQFLDEDNWQTLGPLITEYIAASRRQQEVEVERQRIEAENLRTEQANASRFRRLTRWLSVAAGVAVVATLIALFFLNQANIARGVSEANADVANAESTRAVAAQVIAATSEAEARMSEDLASTREAEALAAEAEVQELKTAIQASQLGLAAQTELANNNPERALLLSVAGLGVVMQSDTQTGLYEAILSPYRATLYGHEGRINAVAVSPDGQTILTASADGTARLWDGRGNELAILGGHAGDVYSAAFTPDGQLIVTASQDGTARLWDVSGNELAVLRGHEGAIVLAVASPDGQVVLTAGDDRTARLWDGAGNELAILRGHEDWVYSAAFSPDGQRIVTASGDGTARLWDLAGNVPVVLSGHEDWVYSAAFNPDGQRIVTASRDGTARLWDLAGNELPVLRHEGAVESAVFSPDGQSIVTASRDGTARLWDMAGNELLRFVHADMVTSALFSPDGQNILTTSLDGSARLWDMAGNQLLAITGQISSAVFGPDGQTIVTASGDGTAQLWNSAEGEVTVLRGHAGTVNSALFSPDGQKIVSVSADSTARLWDVFGNELAVLRGHTGAINSAVFSPDGQTETVLTASSDRTVRLWDMAGNEIAILSGHTSAINLAIFSPDPQLILTTSRDGLVQLWSQEGERIRTLQEHGSSINSAVFSPDGQMVLTAGCGVLNGAICTEGQVWLWDANAEKAELFVWHGHANTINSVAFSPDGQFILTASSDSTARLWDMAGNEIALLSGHTSAINSAQFSPGEQFILTASDDGTARLWDMAGNELAILRGHTNRVRSAVFSPNGQTILTASDDGTMRLWPSFTLAYMIGEAFGRLGRGFTEGECQQFFRDNSVACPRSKKALFEPLVQYLSPDQQVAWTELAE